MKRKINILFIDDENMLIELAESYFEDTDDYDLVAFSDHDSAYEYFIQNNKIIDVVICDQCLAGISGLDLVAKLHKLNSKIYYFIITGSLSLNTNNNEHHNLVTKVLHKPFSFNDLCNILEDLEYGDLDG